MLDKIKYFVYPFTLLGAEMYSAYCSLMGMEHNEGDNRYLLFMLTLFGVSMFFVAHDLVKHWGQINKKVFLIPVFYSVAYLFDCMTESQQFEWTKKAYYFHIFFSLPAISIASILAGTRQVEKIYKNLDVIMLFLALGMIANLPKMMLMGGIIEGYNNISYQSTLAFGYLYYGILSKRHDRYAIFKTKVYRLASVAMCTLLALTSLASGGRGGVVFLFVLMTVISLIYVEKRNFFRAVFLYVPLLLGFVMIVANFVNDSAFNTVLQIGMDRAFSYITESGIDMSQTSNRDEAYDLAMMNINQNPWSGYGIFHTIGKYGYPHNIFLEMLEQGGILYLFVWVTVLLKSIKSALNIIKKSKEVNFLIPLFLYPCTMLLFSGSYLMNTTFWFSICFSLIYSSRFTTRNNCLRRSI